MNVLRGVRRRLVSRWARPTARAHRTGPPTRGAHRVFGPSRPVLAGIDGSDADPRILAWAADEALLRDTELVILHAWQPARNGRAPYAPALRVGSHKLQEEHARLLTDDAVNRIRDRAPGLAVRGVVVSSAAVPALLHAADTAGLLVLGRRTGGAESPLGPVTRACLRRASCPVVTVAATGPFGPPDGPLGSGTARLPQRGWDQAAASRAPLPTVSGGVS